MKRVKTESVAVTALFWEVPAGIGGILMAGGWDLVVLAFYRGAMKRKGSPEPKFETDDERSYFLVVLIVHQEVISRSQAQRNWPQ